MLSTFSNWDWEELAKLLLAMGFVAGFGVLLAMVGGYLTIRIVFDVLFGGFQ